MRTSVFRIIGLSAALLVCLFGISACTSLSYYAQSAIGHSKLMLSRVPIEKAVETAKRENDSQLQKQLAWVQPMRRFASEQLALPNNRSYSKYAEPAGDYPVYTVVAAPQFSLEAKQWCYPVIGCARYRGFFKQSAAIKYADHLKAKGFETSVGGASAYSTLGWFADPVLPSMLRYGEASFAEVLFHELAHQQLYINGDSSFNEAFATVVGETGAQRWLQQYPPQALNEYQQRLLALRQFDQLLASSKSDLEVLYASKLAMPEMETKKATLFSQLKTDYEQLRAETWQGKGWFDSWFSRPVNNARLASFSTYYQRVPALRTLLELCGNDLEVFYRQLAKLKSVDGSVAIPVRCND